MTCFHFSAAQLVRPFDWHKLLEMEIDIFFHHTKGGINLTTSTSVMQIDTNARPNQIIFLVSSNNLSSVLIIRKVTATDMMYLWGIPHQLLVI